MPDALRLIVGLGNPGTQYARTRHNAGFWYLDKLAGHYALQFHYEQAFDAEICRINTAGLDCWLCKPRTFMNKSGAAVRALAAFYKIETSHILVGHDDIDLETGIIRLKQAGGHGGHNGVRHIIQELGSNAFSRLRIGVAHPGERAAVTPYLLGKIAEKDEQIIQYALDNIIPESADIVSGAITKVMNKINQKSPLPA